MVDSTPGSGLTDAGSSGADHKAKLFLIVLIVLHLWDVFTDMSRIGGRWAQWAVIYTFVALFLAPLVFDEGQGFVKSFMNFKKTLVYVVVSALAFFLPLLLDLLPQSITTIRGFSFVVLFSPVWALYVFFSGVDDPLVNKMRNVWLFIWIFLIIVTAVGAVADLRVSPDLQGQYSFSPVDAFNDVWNSVKSSGRRAINRLVGIPDQFVMFVNRNLNDTFARGYRGEVDDHTIGDLGVQFTEIRPFQDEFYEGQKVVVWANVHGESFKDVIRLTLACRAVGNDRSRTTIDGRIVTNGQDQSRVTIKQRQTLGVRCEFDNLTVGYYEVELTGMFDFETWAYIPYYFAPYELVESMWQQDIDPAQDAGIDVRPVAVYTSGPVALGIASEIDQPLPVDPADPLPSIPYGASVISQWPDGKVQSVRYISLLVPEPFVLTGCDQRPVAGTPQNPSWTPDPDTGYRVYTFGDINNDANNYFQSATCFLGLDGDSSLSAQRLVGGYDLVMKTFAAKTGYLYTIEGRESVQVRKRGDTR